MSDFLHKNGFPEVTDDLNQKLSDEQYNMLMEHFSNDKSLKDAAAKFLQERRQRSGGDDTESEIKSEAAEQSESAPVIEQERVETKPEPEPIFEPEASDEPEEPSIQIKTVGRIDLDNTGKGKSRKEGGKSAEEKPKSSRKERNTDVESPALHFL